MVDRSGDPFRSFYDRALPAVYGYLRARLTDPARAEHLTRQVFVAASRQWPLPADVVDEVVFAIGIARGELVDEYRRQDQLVKRRSEFARSSVTAAAHRTTAADTVRAHWALAGVPANQRAALVLRYVDELPDAEVARYVGRNRRATQSLLSRATGTLRRAFADAEQAGSELDLFAAMQRSGVPASPAASFSGPLFTQLRAELDATAVGSTQSAERATGRRPPGRGTAVALAAVVAAVAGVMIWLSPSGSRDGSTTPIDTAGAITTGEPVEHNPDPDVIGPAGVGFLPGGDESGSYDFGGWHVLAPSDYDGRRGAAIAWTGHALIVWGGSAPSVPGRPDLEYWPNDGATLDPATGDWEALPEAPLSPGPTTSLWTGKELLILAGVNGGSAAYNPGEDAWRELPSSPIEEPSAAVWTGTEAILLSPSGEDGAAYDPVTDAWRPIAAIQPATLWAEEAVWTGSEMVVWDVEMQGAQSAAELGIAAYDPGTDTWRRFAPPPFPVDLVPVSGVWTGTELILWGANHAPGSAGSPDDAPLAGVALNPATEEWHQIIEPPFALADLGGGFGAHSAVWTGQLMLVWVGSETGASGPELWSYDPAFNGWQHGASSPVDAPAPRLVWADGVLFAYGSRIDDPLAGTQVLSLEETEGALPEPVGIPLRTYLHPSVPFDVLAASPGAARAEVIDFEAGLAVVYEAGEHFLPRNALDDALPLGDGWLTVGGSVASWFPTGIAQRPQQLHRLEDSGLAPLGYALPAATGDAVWTVQSGVGYADPAATSLVYRISLGPGEEFTTTGAPPDVTPVTVSAAGLLLNTHGWVEYSGFYEEDPATRRMLLVRPDGTLEELGSGLALDLSGDRLTWLACGEFGESCRVWQARLDITADGVALAGPGIVADTIVAELWSQPGVSFVSPDGHWLVAGAPGGDPQDPITLTLFDLESGETRRLLETPRIAAHHLAAWSADSGWLLVSSGRDVVTVDIADRSVVDLSEWIPTDMEVYGVASRP